MSKTDPMKVALWVLLLVGLALGGCSGSGAEPESAADGGPTCSELFMFWWWPVSAVNEFNDPLPEYRPSVGTMEQIALAQEAALKVENTEQAWHRAFVEKWRDIEPETFTSTCERFSAGEREVLVALGEATTSNCMSIVSGSYDDMPRADITAAAKELGIDLPTIASWEAARAWAIDRPGDFIELCRLLTSPVDAASP